MLLQFLLFALQISFASHCKGSKMQYYVLVRSSVTILFSMLLQYSNKTADCLIHRVAMYLNPSSSGSPATTQEALSHTFVMFQLISFSFP